MNKDFLTRLWWVCSAEDGLCKEGLDLCELYEHGPEVREAGCAFDRMLKQLPGCTRAQLDAVGNACSDVMIAAELQGFLNGWRLCAMLQGELAGKGGGKA